MISDHAFLLWSLSLEQALSPFLTFWRIDQFKGPLLLLIRILKEVDIRRRILLAHFLASKWDHRFILRLPSL